MTRDYLVWSNEHRSWWRAGGWGYSFGLDLAGRFTRDEAIAICRRALPTALGLRTISEIPVRIADIDELLEGGMVPEAVLRHSLRPCTHPQDEGDESRRRHDSDDSAASIVAATVVATTFDTSPSPSPSYDPSPSLPDSSPSFDPGGGSSGGGGASGDY